MPYGQQPTHAEIAAHRREVDEELLTSSGFYRAEHFASLNDGSWVDEESEADAESQHHSWNSFDVGRANKLYNWCFIFFLLYIHTQGYIRERMGKVSNLP